MNDVIVSKLQAGRGKKATAEELAQLTSNIEWTPQWLIDLMRSYPLVGAHFALDSHLDESELGVDMRWLTAPQILKEALDSYPGIAAATSRYIPVGACLLGTGDPYFIHAVEQDTALYRIPHTAVSDDDTLDVSQVERVSPSIEHFFEVADVT